jgi:hypothetical protein
MRPAGELLPASGVSRTAERVPPDRTASTPRFSELLQIGGFYMVALIALALILALFGGGGGRRWYGRW